MANATNIPGGIISARANTIGGLNTAIGWGHKWHGMTLPAGFALDQIIDERHIGSPGPDQINDVGSVADKGLAVKQATGTVAPDGEIVTGWLNKTGVSLVTGEYAIAVQA